MQKTIAAFVLFLFGLFSNAQYFSGEIHYKTTIFDKVTGEIRKVHTAILTVGDGFYRYRQNTQKDFTFENTYIEKEGKYYTQRKGTPYITYEVLDDGEGTYTPYEIFKDSTEIILGNKAFLGVKRFPVQTQKNFYSDAVRVNPEDYAGFCHGGKYNHLKQLQGRLPLKTITIYDDYDFIAVREAVKIKKKRLRPRHMRFPKGVNIAARIDVEQARKAYYRNLKEDYTSCMYDKTNRDKRKYYDEAYLKEQTQKVRFKMIWTTDKQIKDLTLYESDDPALNEPARDIINNCKPDFGTLLIEDKPVDMEVYYEVRFFER